MTVRLDSYFDTLCIEHNILSVLANYNLKTFCKEAPHETLDVLFNFVNVGFVINITFSELIEELINWFEERGISFNLSEVERLFVILLSFKLIETDEFDIMGYLKLLSLEKKLEIDQWFAPFYTQYLTKCDLSNGVSNGDLKYWDKHWLGFAKELSKYSTCFSRQIGGVLVKENQILSIGWNGPPNSLPNCSVRNKDELKICPRKLLGAKSGERLDLCVAVHTEVSCILNSIKAGKSTQGAVLYIDCQIPCKDCMAAIINSGIIRVVCNKKGSATANFGLFYDQTSEYIYKHSYIKIDFLNL